MRPALLLWITGVLLIAALALTLYLGAGLGFLGLVSGAVILLIVASVAFTYVFVALLAPVFAVVFPRRWACSVCPECGEKRLSRLPVAFAAGSSAADGTSCRFAWPCYACGHRFVVDSRERRRVTAAHP